MPQKTLLEPVQDAGVALEPLTKPLNFFFKKKEKSHTAGVLNGGGDTALARLKHAWAPAALTFSSLKVIRFCDPGRPHNKFR